MRDFLITLFNVVLYLIGLGIVYWLLTLVIDFVAGLFSPPKPVSPNVIKGLQLLFIILAVITVIDAFFHVGFWYAPLWHK